MVAERPALPFVGFEVSVVVRRCRIRIHGVCDGKITGWRSVPRYFSMRFSVIATRPMNPFPGFPADGRAGSFHSLPANSSQARVFDIADGAGNREIGDD